MGGNLDIREYDSQLTKSQVEKEFDCDQATSAYDHGHSYSGQIGVMNLDIFEFEIRNLNTYEKDLVVCKTK